MGGLIPKDIRAEAQAAAEAYARRDVEDIARAHVAQRLIVGPEVVAALLDRLDRRDGCHSRHEDIEAAARLLLATLDETTRPAQPAIDDAAARLRAVLVHHGAGELGVRQRAADEARVRVAQTSQPVRHGRTYGPA
jgi:hypothetical protein